MKNHFIPPLAIGSFCAGVLTGSIIELKALMPETQRSTPTVAKSATVTAVPVVQDSLTTASREESALLWAISQVESGGDWKAVSTDGEHWGAYQISHDIFGQYWAGGIPAIAHATLGGYIDGKKLCVITPDEQTACALWWLRKLEHGKPFDVKALAALWLGKPDADYCQRVENLYELKIKQN